MTYKEKAEKFRELAYKAQGLDYPPKERWIKDPAPPRQKWNSMEELNIYLEDWGGRLKADNKRRRGFLVAPLQDASIQHNAPLVAEVPMDFAMKVLSMGGFP